MKYIVLGAGKQGLAAAYDLIVYGRAARLTLADSSSVSQGNNAKEFRKLLELCRRQNKRVLSYRKINVHNNSLLKSILREHDAVLSALPYYLNLSVAEAAIAAKVHYCDLGGYFEMTQKILKLHRKAKKAGVTLVPDCGVSPGMCNSLAVCAMDQFDRTEDVHIYCGGLPQMPRPPLGYKVVFNLEGVLGNYFGKAYLLRNGKITLAAPLSEREEIDLGAPLGKLEAAITGGATSTCPWTFRGKIKNYDYKTLRYPGHWEKIDLLKQLGLMEIDPVEINGHKIVPRKIFAKIVEPRLRFQQERDLLVMRVIVCGLRHGKKIEIRYDLMDYADPKTGFSAMQRTTGFSAAIILEMLAQGFVQQKGVVPLEKAISGSLFLKEIRKRGIHVKETIRWIN